MRKCKSLRPCQGNVNKSTSLLTLSRAMQTIFAIRRFSNSTKVYHSQNLLKLSKSSQDLKFRLTARQSRNRWQTLTLGTKLATRATNGKFGVTQNRLSGGLGLNRGNWDFSGCIISSSLASLELQRTEHQPNL